MNSVEHILNGFLALGKLLSMVERLVSSCSCKATIASAMMYFTIALRPLTVKGVVRIAPEDLNGRDFCEWE